MEICTSHYNEDLKWLEKSEFPVIIVTHEGGDTVDHTYKIPNVGYEATAYLKYIIERYDTLPNHVAFIHGHEESYHQLGDRSMLEMIKTANIQNYGYIPLNNCWRCIITNSMIMIDCDLKQFSLDPYFIICASAQFIVSKDKILSNPIEFYKNLYSMIKTKIDAVYFELVWHMIFKCGNSIVPKNDHFYPKLKEIRYTTGTSLTMILSKFKPCYIGNDYPFSLGLIHITNQTEYDYYSTRGGSFFTREDLYSTSLNYTFDYNNIDNIKYMQNVFNNAQIFDSITKTFDNVHY